TTIAASPYQKEQTIRGKRQTQDPIFKTNGADKPTEQQIKEKLIKKYPHIESNQIKVKNITINSVNITIDGFSGERILTFIVDKSFDLTKIIEKTNLGSIITYGIKLPKEQWLKDWLKQLNPNLDISKIKVENISNNNATIVSSDNSFYSGKVNITYIISLKSIITNTDLGSIITNGIDLPSEQQIKNKLKEKNNIFDKNNNILLNIEVKDITRISAKLSYKYPNIYANTVDVFFTSNINLNKIITQPNLGEFKTENLSSPTKQQIKNKLKEMYNNLDITKINVENISNNNAIINSFDTNTYTGNINVNYTVSIDSLNW
ncbi:hypothetical protein, partial [Spiroplasma sp. ald]|uniref:hypothetical protein n=1 Tax=Spiroplasma sp. ald TaxID=2490849 RepID=UPI0037DD5982